MKMRKKLLIELLEKDNYSGNEKVIIPMVTEELINLGFRVSVDDIGNISAVRGSALKYPLLNAHLDQVEWNDWRWSTTTFNKTTTKSTLPFDSYDSGYAYDNGSIYLKAKKSYSGDIAMTDELMDELDLLTSVLSTEELSDHFDCGDCQKSKKGCKACQYNMLCDEFIMTYPVYYKWARIAQQLYGMDINSFATDYIDETVIEKEEFRVYEKNNKIYGTGGRVLGGDDKCGIFIAFEVARLMRNTPMKILFTVKEEVGCVGIKHFVDKNEAWFDDVEYSITIDRRYGNNLLWSQLGKRSCSNEFASRLAMAGIKVGIPIAIEDGSVADVVEIRELVKESVNISAGYYNPHCEDEYVNLEDVVRIIKWVRLFIQEERVSVI